MKDPGLFKGVVQRIGVPLIVAEASGGAIQFANTAAEVCFGLTAGALFGRHLGELYVEPQIYQRHIAALARRGRLHSAEAQLHGTAGTILPMSISIESLFVEHKPVIVATFHDLTRLRQTETDLKIRVEFEELLSAISTRFITLGSDELGAGLGEALGEIARVTLASSGFVVLLDRSQHIDESISYLVKEDQRPLWQNLTTSHLPWLLERVRGDEMLQLTSQQSDLPMRSGSYSPFSAVILPIVYDRDLRGLLGLESNVPHKGWVSSSRSLKTVARVFANVLQRHDAEEERDSERLKANKLEAIGLLAGGIAHDFRNILGVIQGSASLAQLSLHNPSELTELLQEIVQAGRRAKDLTEQLLTFSKGGAPIKRRVEIPELIDESANFSLRGSNVSCRLDIDEELWPAEVDGGQISQVLNNMLINATQAMPDGGTLDVCASNADEVELSKLGLSGRYIVIEVEDHGIGIPESSLSRVFDPYFTTKEEGTGLGLATAYSIIKNHNGLIRVESEPGKGARFTIYLPALAIASNREKQPTDQQAPTGQGRILVVDDDLGIRRVTLAMLKKLGFDCGAADDGRAAIEAYRRAMVSDAPFDAVLMDLTIPGGLGGREALGEVLALDPEAKVVVSSGYSNDPVMADYRRHGFTDVLPKPFTVSELSRLLQRILTD